MLNPARSRRRPLSAPQSHATTPPARANSRTAAERMLKWVPETHALRRAVAILVRVEQATYHLSPRTFQRKPMLMHRSHQF
jgi:hypothetical protein